ncbi:DNA polymerase III subunit gamma/tau [Bacillus sp. FJAT-45350]|uniref:DNA polymerase III subunit gamma/tau n=1 Tax=Bacillus sp. FJAT-45350 TaxID=2011014 RepID=UPI000BB6FF9E|nr:DNA polymerase III subunit gamma/tau [Bacillus sp. FJAT-45350]
MGYQALYRVWRPQQLKDIAGQEHITTTLQNALVHNKFSHAYLFTGPRGTGKTSAAKIVSKAINCENAPVPEPCNECKSCKGITDGSIVDVIEIDAASNNGVDEIRDIRDKVKFAPNEVRYKVYIIDEVHMLSTGAFNALLKTLEEPPKHVIFILATTEPHKIPLTIISRCQRFDFKRISKQALVNRMKFILSHNETVVQEEALQMVALAADGGMRDALSLLDQAISYAEDEVTLESILSITGAVSERFLSDVISAVHSKDVAAALKAIGLLINEGKDPQRFIEDLIFYYRDLLLYQTAPQLAEMLERAKVDEQFKDFATIIPSESIYKMIELLNQCQQEMKWASHPKVFMELLIVKLCNHEVEDKVTSGAVINNEDIELLKKKINELEGTIKQLQRNGVVAEASDDTSEQRKQPVRRPVKQVSGTKLASGQIKELLSRASKLELQRVTSKWGQVMERVRQQNIPAHAWLSDCKPVAASQDAYLLAFQNEMHRDMVDSKFRDFVDTVIDEVFGQKMTFFTILSGQWDKLKEDFLKGQRGEDGEEEKDPVIEEGIKLVGSELVEIIE